jgi:hypothetical protein
MIQYLGELIAAQHYVEAPFMPMVLIGHSTDDGSYDYNEVPLFVVKRGIELPGRVAVVAPHQGQYYYIPQPEFGSAHEARSLQVMDLVLQTARAATQKTDIPKTLPAVTVASP